MRSFNADPRNPWLLSQLGDVLPARSSFLRPASGHIVPSHPGDAPPAAVTSARPSLIERSTQTVSDLRSGHEPPPEPPSTTFPQPAGSGPSSPPPPPAHQAPATPPRTPTRRPPQHYMPTPVYYPDATEHDPTPAGYWSDDEEAAQPPRSGLPSESPSLLSGLRRWLSTRHTSIEAPPSGPPPVTVRPVAVSTGTSTDPPVPTSVNTAATQTVDIVPSETQTTSHATQTLRPVLVDSGTDAPTPTTVSNTATQTTQTQTSTRETQTPRHRALSDETLDLIFTYPEQFSDWRDKMELAIETTQEELKHLRTNDQDRQAKLAHIQEVVNKTFAEVFSGLGVDLTRVPGPPTVDNIEALKAWLAAATSLLPPALRDKRALEQTYAAMHGGREVVDSGTQTDVVEESVQYPNANDDPMEQDFPMDVAIGRYSTDSMAEERTAEIFQIQEPQYLYPIVDTAYGQLHEFYADVGNMVERFPATRRYMMPPPPGRPEPGPSIPRPQRKRKPTTRLGYDRKMEQVNTTYDPKQSEPVVISQTPRKKSRKGKEPQWEPYF